MNSQVLILSFVVASSILTTYIGRLGRITFPALAATAFTSVFTVFMFLCQQLKSGCLGSCSFVYLIPWAMFIGAAFIFYEVWKFE